MKVGMRCSVLLFFAVLVAFTIGCAGGSSSVSQIAAAPTPPPNPSPTPPPAPTPTPTPVPAHSVSITWQASSSTDVVSYNVYRSLASGGPYTRVAGVPGASFTDVNVLAGTTYFYEISAVNSSGVESPASSPAQSINVPQ